MHMSPQAWFAVWATVAFLAVFATCCFLPLAWEAWHGKRYRAETPRFAAAEEIWWQNFGAEYRATRGKLLRLPTTAVEPEPATRRWTFGELLTRAAGRVSDIALGIWRRGGGNAS